MAITNAQQYKQILQKEREEKAFGGVMGIDGRRAYVGGSYSGDDPDKDNKVSKSRGSGAYQGGSGVAGSAESKGMGGSGSQYKDDGGYTSDNNPTGTVDYGKAQQQFQQGIIDTPPSEKNNEIMQKVADFLNPRKRIYNMFPNNPKNEKAYINYLKAQGLNLPQNILEMLDEEDKLTYDQFETLRNYEPDFMLPGEEGLYKPMDFPSYMASQGNFGLITKGNLGNLKDFKNPGTIIDPATGLPMSDLAFDKLKQSSSQYSIGNNDRANEQTDPCLGPNPPAYCAVNNDPTEEEDATPDRNLGGLAPRFAGSIFDFTGLADGGRAGAMDGGRMMNDDDPTGGIMDLESGRQMYFLGKLVKKATRAVKKVAKSPVGKAALLYFGGKALMGGMKGSSLFGKGPGSAFVKMFGANNTMPGFENLSTAKMGGFLESLGLTKGYGSMMPTISGGILAASALPLLMGQKEEDEEIDRGPGLNIADIRNNPYNYLSARNQGSRFAADGGLMRTGYAEGSKEPVAKKTMPLLDMDGQEMDLREEGGFVPLGRMERADDVPARLSKNEFVFTADAVRNAGEGDVDKGAEVMYNMMKNLESGGEVSEESQGLDGAREMFKTSQRLEEVI